MIPCPLPWTGIAVNPNGSVRCCAMSQQTIGNLQRTPLTVIVDNKHNQQIRQSLRDGQWPDNCRLCQQREEIDPEFSNRAYQLKLHQDLNPGIYNTNVHTLTQLDLRWSNTCNYACVYCGPELSSSWAAELGKKYINQDKENFLALKKHVWNNLSNLREVYLAGGEPLLIKENTELLNQLHQHNPDCLIRITTNLSNLNTEVYQQIQQFKNVQWEVSVEATGSQFEYIRYPGTWDLFESNIKQLLQQWPSRQIGLTMNYFLLTSNTIIETGKHFINLGVDPDRIAVHYLINPEYLDARNMNKKYIDSTFDYLNTYQGSTTFATSLQNCSKFFTKSFDRNTKNTVNSLNNLDKRRNLNFNQVFPKLKEMIS
jgi:radical SAM protein with 4Fe4S-binding SPASM domain